MTRSGGREVLWPGPWFTPPPTPGLGQTNARENITFARFATRAVISITKYMYLILMNILPKQESIPVGYVPPTCQPYVLR